MNLASNIMVQNCYLAANIRADSLFGGTWYRQEQSWPSFVREAQKFIKNTQA